MDSNSLKKREHELEKRLRTPKSVLSREKHTELDTEETQWLINTFLAGKFYLYETTTNPEGCHIESDRSELEEIHHREKTLTEIKDILKEWIVDVAKDTGMEETFAKDEEARIFTFGSHRLGVNSRGGDIDTVVLCPEYVDRNKHFFENLYERLQKEPQVDELVKVNDPRVLVPVIKMTFNDIPIDLAFAKLDVPKLDEKLKNLNNNDLLMTMDEKMVYSVNGPRNVDMIIQSVDPKEDPGRIANFRTTLKLLKLWAKNKGIYSNAMGYVTGISLAILVAKICQLFPNLKPNKLVQKFFQYYSIWNWDEFPVQIEEIKTYENLERFNDMQWYDPRSEIGIEKINQKKKDEYTSPMMVPTPAFPVMNSTKKVLRTNLDIIKDQLQQGKEIVQQKPVNWTKLFEKIDFFNIYYNFIEVSVLANDEKEYYRWSGLIESQLIALTKALENQISYEEHPRNLRLHPYPVGFEKPDANFAYCQSFYYGLKFLKPPTSKEQEEMDLFTAVFEFISRLMKKREEGQYYDVNLRVLHLKRDELPRTVFGEPMEERIVVPTSTTKRVLEVSHENEFEPNVVKKIHAHPKEDMEVKSSNHTNSTTGSPHEDHDTYAMNGVGHRSFHDTSMLSDNKENVNIEDDAKKSSAHALLKDDRRGAKIEGTGKTLLNAPVLVKKTDFKTIDTSSLLEQSNELDDFL